MQTIQLKKFGEVLVSRPAGLESFNAIRPNLVALDPSKLTVQIGWPSVINQADKPDNWTGSKIAVKVTYQWFPELYFTDPISLTSTSIMPITN